MVCLHQCNRPSQHTIVKSLRALYLELITSRTDWCLAYWSFPSLGANTVAFLLSPGLEQDSYNSHLLPSQFMAASASSNAPIAGGRPDFKMPMPPPLLHTRSGNEIYETAPHTPTGAGFTSPYATPQGSPSKNKLPPGANELPNVFENAMKLTPGSPAKLGRQQLSPHSPNKSNRQGIDENVDDSYSRVECSSGLGGPTRKTGKENTPPGIRQAKPATPTQAAVSRQEPYQSKDTDSGARSRYSPQRGLTSEELEKLQLPKVKRLANVTQLCELFQSFSPALEVTFDRLP